jgi:enoyl-CoA hydratase/carnithine racemase
MSTADAVANVEAEEILLRQDDAGIATLTLNRPAARNGLSLALLEALSDELADIAADAAVRVVVLAANGPVFCAGHDLKEIRANRSLPFYRDTLERCARMMKGIVRLPKPVIAKVHGVATAAGCQLVASCDLAMVADSARFATPGVHIGLFCSTPMVALSRNVSRKHAMEMLLTGDLVDAETAVRFGLVNRAVPAETLDAEVDALARHIASKSSHTLAIGKEAFYRQLELDLDAAYEYTSEVMLTNLMARDAEEGITAFIEKREPVWRDE